MQLKSLKLDGQWKLYYYPQGQYPIDHPSGLDSLGLVEQPISAVVPGNVELDLVAAGIIPDPRIGENIHQLLEYEQYEWWYERKFTVDELTNVLANGRADTQDEDGRLLKKPTVELLFNGVDCFATYWLDGREIGRSDNMLIEHRFDVTGLLVPGRQHVLSIRLQSPILEALQRTYDPSSYALPVNFESLWIRKAPHSFGWDIFGRAISFGLWRSVEVVVHDPNEIAELYVTTTEATHKQATIQLFYQLAVEPRKLSDLKLRVTGVCRGTHFTVTKKLKFAYGNIELSVDNPKLWWPRGYGEADLYTLTTELLHQDEVIACRTDSIGIRTIELLRSDVTTLEQPGQFQFKVNGAPIQIKGSNWVPMDMFHSKDAARYAEAIALAVDLNCNMLRSWGGNVYEDHAFFDLCDRHGILVWQDFAMACAIYPQAQEFQEMLRKEATAVVRKLRNHPSLAVWAGDNECDEFFLLRGLNPNQNILTRKVLPEVVFQCDPYRPYVPSSPYVSPEAYKLNTPTAWPERHLWGVRDYFKSVFYSTANMHFIGEMGYHGCPSLSTMQKFLDPAYLWPWQDNKQWITHGTDPLGDPESMYHFRVKLMADQIGELFGDIPDTIEDFILASQISQAEAKKFFIENSRMKPQCSGILWWNLLDGWPQFSDAVVDYYGDKKLAYHYIKRVQQPVCVMIDEPHNWHVAAKVGNDSNQAANGTFRVWDGDSGETMLEGAFEVLPGCTNEIGKIRAPYSAQRLLLIEWVIDGVTYGNHYMMGSPGFSFQQYRGWLDKIAALPFSFNAEQLGS
jgi:beta-mannosidase